MEQTVKKSVRAKDQEVMTFGACALQSQKRVDETMKHVREEMSAAQEKQDKKLDDISATLAGLVKSVDQILYKMDAPQIGITDRITESERTVKETTSVLLGMQQVLSGLVDSRKKADKFMDIIIGGVIAYVLVRLLPYVGQLLQK